MVTWFKDITQEQCKKAGFHWVNDGCYIDPEGTSPVPVIVPEDLGLAEKGQFIMEHVIGLYDTCTDLAYQDPPEGLLDRIFWSLGVFFQVVISTATFPAALASFLLEEPTSV